MKIIKFTYYYFFRIFCTFLRRFCILAIYDSDNYLFNNINPINTFKVVFIYLSEINKKIESLEIKRTINRSNIYETDINYELNINPIHNKRINNLLENQFYYINHNTYVYRYKNKLWNIYFYHGNGKNVWTVEKFFLYPVK